MLTPLRVLSKLSSSTRPFYNHVSLPLKHYIYANVYDTFSCISQSYLSTVCTSKKLKIKKTQVVRLKSLKILTKLNVKYLDFFFSCILCSWWDHNYRALSNLSTVIVCGNYTLKGINLFFFYYTLSLWQIPLSSLIVLVDSFELFGS